MVSGSSTGEPLEPHHPGASPCRKGCSKVLPCGNAFESNPLCCMFSFYKHQSPKFSVLMDFFRIVFNWRIIALENSVVFCHKSTRISHRYTHVPSLPSPSSSHPSACHRGPVWVPWVIQQIPIGYLFYMWYCKFLCYSPMHLTFSLLSFDHVLIGFA